MKPKQLFFFIAGSLLTALTAEGFANVHLPGRLLVVLNGTSYQENYPVPELIYFVPEYSLTLLEDMLTAFNASRIDSEPDGNGTFRCYLLNSDEFYSSREQERFLCISPELQLDKTNQQVISRSEEMQGEWQWYNALAFVGSGVADLFVQQFNSLLAGFWKSLFHYDTDSEETGTNNTVVVLPEPPSSLSSNRALSGSSYPFEPPPPPFMPGIPAKGLFDMPGWEFDYLLSLALINQRLKQWIHGWYHTTARKSGQPVSAFDLSMALEGVKQEGAINKSLFRHLPSDASELLAQLTGKDLPGYHPPHQTETVILYPVFVLPQSASNRFEETKDAEFVGTACSICQEAFKESDKVVKTPCLHLYHIGCLNHWMTTEMSTCPSCRGDIEGLRAFLNLELQSNLKQDFAFWRRLASSNSEIPELDLRHDQAYDLVCYLGRLTGTADYQNQASRPVLAQRVMTVMSLLAGDDRFRETALRHIHDALSSCDDRIILALDDLETLQLLTSAETLAFEKRDPRELKALGLQMMRLDAVNRFARDHMRTLSLSWVDAIEVALAFQIGVRQQLDPPGSTQHMIFRGCAHVSDQDIANAVQYVNTYCSETQLEVYLAQWPPWQKFQRLLAVPSFDQLASTTVTSINDCFVCRKKTNKMVMLSDIHLDYDTLVKAYLKNGKNPFTNTPMNWSSVARLIEEAPPLFLK